MSGYVSLDSIESAASLAREYSDSPATLANVDAVAADVAVHETRLDAAEGDITALEADVADHESRITDLENP